MRQLPDDHKELTRADKIYILTRYRWQVQKIDNDIDRLGKQNAKLYSPKIPSLSKEPKAGRSLDTAGRIANRDELEERILQKEKELDDLKTWMDKCIRTIDDPQLELLVCYRYIDGLSIQDIAAEMSYSYSRCKDLHNIAIKKIVILSKDRPQSAIIGHDRP